MCVVRVCVMFFLYNKSRRHHWPQYEEQAFEKYMVYPGRKVFSDMSWLSLAMISPVGLIGMRNT